MKRRLSSLVICAYLGVLGFGLVSHTFQYANVKHPLMYYIIWDMFCGWSAYADATKIVAEGESGKFYELAPGPWGEIHPYGSVGRHDYDNRKDFYVRLASNTLRHTQHEPIARIVVLEEIWSKIYDLPDDIWKARYDEPKEVHKYYRQRAEMTGDCRVIRRYSGWHDNQATVAVIDNPRLMNDSRSSQSVFALEQPRLSGNVPMTAPSGN